MIAPVLHGGPAVQGILRRRIILDARTPGRTRAAVEDDFHHFAVDICHTGGMVTAVEGQANRYPWSTCPGATPQLADFVGCAIGPALLRRRDLPDPLMHCTHLYELALLAIAQAGRGGIRTYDVIVPDRAGRTRFPTIGADGEVLRPAAGADGRMSARVRRDGTEVLAWDVEGDNIVAPEGFAGHTLWTVMRFAIPHCDDDALEAVRVLRRGIHVAGGRIFAFEESLLASMSPAAAGACYTFQPVRAANSRRMIDAAFDFTNHPDALLADFYR